VVDDLVRFEILCRSASNAHLHAVGGAIPLSAGPSITSLLWYRADDRSRRRDSRRLCGSSPRTARSRLRRRGQQASPSMPLSPLERALRWVAFQVTRASKERPQIGDFRSRSGIVFRWSCLFSIPNQSSIPSSSCSRSPFSLVRGFLAALPSCDYQHEASPLVGMTRSMPRRETGVVMLPLSDTPRPLRGAERKGGSHVHLPSFARPIVDGAAMSQTQAHYRCDDDHRPPRPVLLDPLAHGRRDCHDLIRGNRLIGGLTYILFLELTVYRRSLAPLEGARSAR